MTITRRRFVQFLSLATAAGCGGGAGSDDASASRDVGADGDATSDRDATSPLDASMDAAVDGDVVDADVGVTSTISPWGIATSHARSQGLAWLTTIAGAGFRCIRGIDYAAIDQHLGEAEALGMETTGILQSGTAFPAGDLTAWRAFVTDRVRSANGRITMWEIWNEPPNFSTDDDPAHYAAIVVAAYEAIRAVDPSAKVGLCAASVHLNFMDRALAAGAADHFDYITLHPYETQDLIESGLEGQFMGIVKTVRAMLRRRNPTRANVPILFTELGAPVDATHDAEHQVRVFVKAYVLSIAQGVTRVHWFEGQDGDSGPFGLVAGDGSARPSLTAARTLVTTLGERPTYVGWVLLTGNHYGFVFRSDMGPVLIAWARPNVTAAIDLGTTVEVIDPSTGTSSSVQRFDLTPSPRIVRGIPAGLVTIAATNRGQPFSWGGDFTDAPSVVAMPDRESGLHFAGIPRTSTIDGGVAYDASATSAMRFTVDPNFLTYDTVPIRVTAVVRRNGSASAGFNLKYESTTGTRSTGGWNDVSSSTAWQTITWDIDDPQFVGKWGFHVMLDSDATSHSAYSLQSLTIAKR